MSTLALADLGPAARRSLGLPAGCRVPSCASGCTDPRVARWLPHSGADCAALPVLHIDTIVAAARIHGTIGPSSGRCHCGPTRIPDSPLEHAAAMNQTQPSVAESPRLFAVCLGGRAPGCRVELHDVAFAVGTDLESTHMQLLDQWFGSPDGLHVDAWAVLDRVPGYRIELVRGAPAQGPKLYFVNIGGYRPGEFGERHALAFYAGPSPAGVKARARRELLPGKDSVNRDDLHAIDDLIEVSPGEGWALRLIADTEAGAAQVTNGYFPLPRRTISAWRRSRKGAG